MVSMSFWKVVLSVAVLSDCRVMEKSALSATGSSFVVVAVFVGVDVDADADALLALGVNETCSWEAVEFIIVALLCCYAIVCSWSCAGSLAVGRV